MNQDFCSWSKAHTETQATTEVIYIYIYMYTFEGQEVKQNGVAET